MAASQEAATTAPAPPSGLRALRHVYTAHDTQADTAVFTKIRRGSPTPYDDGRLAIDDVYAASTVSGAPGRVHSPHDRDAIDGRRTTCGVLSAGVASPGGGTVCRVVDMAPGHECETHRGGGDGGAGGRGQGHGRGHGVGSGAGAGAGAGAMNIDYAIVVEGEVTLRLASGEETVLGPGDVAVQRAGSHAWRNPSDTAWARMVLVLQDCRGPSSVDRDGMRFR
ncbi:cupin domain-containing protein [Purpureocillium lavendulum]|uniref:Cupin domain-containing protein n=1 Tax=Purpureocillium lavendulum TaxID=1247861 RepID=A0AB34G2L1_9HYPO|nr:cupin domain-containing protein [Purpureocillium lavendulum]